MQMKNDIYLHELTNGRYGRKIAYTDYERVDSNNVLEVLANTISIFWFNRKIAQYLWEYKNGNQPALYRTKKVRPEINNKVIENHAYEFVQFSVTQTYGEPIQYVRRNKGEDGVEDARLDKAVDELNKIMHNCFKDVKNASQGEWKVATGTSFLALRRTKNPSKPIAITVPTPLNTYIVYSSVTEEPVLAVQMLKNPKGETYYKCYTDRYIYKIQNSKFIEQPILHAFKAIPIVEIPNNQDRISDIELVITMLDAINTMQSNRMDGIEQFIQAFFKFVNCEIDEKTFEQMRMTGALVVKSNNGTENKADIDVITTELDQTQSQVAKEDILNNALSILAIPNKQGGTGGDSQGAVELRNGWDFAKGRAKIKDAYVIEGESRFAELALNALAIDDINLGITVNDFDVQVTHSPSDNLLVKAQAMQLLLQMGVHPLLVFKQTGLFPDAEKAYNLSKPYMDMIYANGEDSKNLVTITKQIDAFIQMVANGISPDVAIEQLGMDKSLVDNSPAMAQYDFQPTDKVEVIE